ncbi:substrate-binding periplasmic protein [Desulfovibrio gilichinskyi]|uniref:Amino acid ABC transporter substrate-binding protein, PAAT family n=1 Tax=Desulfovibrio gilichinskyi TaxID=1519643 RepID=A0A1X7CDW7_9BACT|nr:transporter substrate-binding domain-containing protein [Desulfovibrio gilichinskyi]SME94901.1 amino acid ABC transporter substrate-binding protein, PAAT family [Desulfovibrio gilichinskyi]
MYKKIVIFNILFILVPCIVYSSNLVITTLDNPPQAYLENDVPNGVLVDIVSAIVKKSGCTCTIKVVPWRRALKMVQIGTADAIFNAGYTADRNEYLFYPSCTLITEKVIALRRKGAGVFLKADLSNAKDYKVGVGRGFYYGKEIQNAIDSNMFMRVEEVPNINLNMEKLKLDRIDMFFADYLPAMKFLDSMNSKADIELIVDPKTGKPIVYGRSDTYLAFSRKTVPNGLAEKINEELVKFKKTGVYDEIIRKYIKDYINLE